MKQQFSTYYPVVLITDMFQEECKREIIFQLNSDNTVDQFTTEVRSGGKTAATAVHSGEEELEQERKNRDSKWPGKGSSVVNRTETGQYTEYQSHTRNIFTCIYSILFIL